MQLSPGTNVHRAAAPAMVAAALLLAACVSASASQRELDRFIELRGALLSAETTYVGTRGRYESYTVLLRSNTGLSATGKLLRPAAAPAAERESAPEATTQYPGVLLNDGRELNSDAVNYLPEDFGDVVVLSLDYPEELPYELRLGNLFLRSGELRRALRRVPPMFSMGAEYLEGREDVDSERIAIAATSFAVPFATIAAAMDERFANAALIYGAGSFPAVLGANVDMPRPFRGFISWLVTRPFADLEPDRFVHHIASRPLIMINGEDDPQIPRAAVLQLYDAALEPKTLIWLRTGHLQPTDTTLIRTLVDTAFARMPVLR